MKFLRKIALGVGIAVCSAGVGAVENPLLAMPANNSAVNVRLNVANGQNSVRIGDSVQFCFSVDRPGYLSLWDIGTDNTVHRIFPVQNNTPAPYVAAQHQHCIGSERDGSWFRVSGPPGVENVVAFWSQAATGQPLTASYPNPQAFIRMLEQQAKSIIAEYSRDDWASANVSFAVLDTHGTANDVVVPGDKHRVAKTDTHDYANVYIVGFGADVDPLRKTNDDMRYVAALAQASFGAAPENVRLYPNAYRSDFVKAFAWLKKVAGPNDLVITVYSGHGKRIDDDNHDEADGLDEALVPYDLNDLNKRYSSEYYIRDDELRRWYDDLNAATVVAFFDACYSGGLYKGFADEALLNGRVKYFPYGTTQSRPKDAPFFSDPAAQQPDFPNNGKTRYALISAAGADEYAIEDARIGGVFTATLGELLQNGNHYRDWAELSEVLSRSLSRRSGGKQNPVVIDPDGVLKRLKFQ